MVQILQLKDKRDQKTIFNSILFKEIHFKYNDTDNIIKSKGVKKDIPY